MTTIKTPEQIIEYVNGPEAKNDFLGFTREVLIPHLPFEHAKPFLKEGTEEKDWDPNPLERGSLIEEMRSYAAFGWEKVEGHRGISAGRTIEKMAAWLWLLGENELRSFVMDSRNYAYYGAPSLAAVCRKFEFPIPDGEDVARMINGEPCEDGCEMGCDV